MRSHINQLFLTISILLIGINLAEAQNSPTEKKDSLSTSKAVKTIDVPLIHILSKKGTARLDSVGLEKVHLPHLKAGDFFTVQIEGINSNLYSISLNSKDTSLSKPAEFPTFKSISLEDVSGLIENLVPSTKGAIEKIVKQDPNSNFSKSLTPYLSLSEEQFEMRPEVKYLSETIVILDKYSDNLLEKNLEILEIQRRANNLYNDVQIFLATTAQGILCDKDTFKIELCTFLDDHYKIMNRIQNLKNEISNIENQVQLNQGQFSSSNDANSVLLKVFDQLSKVAIKLNENLDKIEENMKGDNYRNAVKMLTNHELKSERIAYTSLPLQLVKEQKELKISIKPKDENSGLPSWESTYFIPGPTDQYAAAGASFYFAGLIDENYSILKTINAAGDTISSLAKEDDGIGEVGSAVLFRFGQLTNSGKCGYHLTVGPGISLNNKPKPRLFLGAGFSFGKTHALALDGGLVAGFVNKLSNAYNLNQDYIQIEEPTVTTLKTAGFLSVGYIYRF